MFLLGAHSATVLIYACLAIQTTMWDHSGYHLPFVQLSSPQFHDYHHAFFNECFGVLGWLDYLHGTDQRFRKSVSFRRHHWLRSFTPAQ